MDITNAPCNARISDMAESLDYSQSFQCRTCAPLCSLASQPCRFFFNKEKVARSCLLPWHMEKRKGERNPRKENNIDASHRFDFDGNEISHSILSSPFRSPPFISSTLSPSSTNSLRTTFRSSPRLSTPAHLMMKSHNRSSASLEFLVNA